MFMDLKLEIVDNVVGVNSNIKSLRSLNSQTNHKYNNSNNQNVQKQIEFDIFDSRFLKIYQTGFKIQLKLNMISVNDIFDKWIDQSDNIVNLRIMNTKNEILVNDSQEISVHNSSFKLNRTYQFQIAIPQQKMITVQLDINNRQIGKGCLDIEQYLLTNTVYQKYISLMIHR